jgi:uncharacterized protein (TIGR00255 family)
VALEVDVINAAKSALKRGKVDIFVTVTTTAGTTSPLPSLDPLAVTHMLKLASTVAELATKVPGAPIPGPLTMADLLNMPQCLAQSQRTPASPDDDPDAHREPVLKALATALAAVIASRKKEGGALGEALGELLSDLERDRREVAARRDTILAHLQATYLKRLEQALAQMAKTHPTGQTIAIPEDRALLEVAILSDKADIEEELTRLATHIAEMRRLLADGEGAGRKLDFLCQEMHREVNTISSKLVPTEVSQVTLEMKQTVERIRQQVQNIE